MLPWRVGARLARLRLSASRAQVWRSAVACDKSITRLHRVHWIAPTIRMLSASSGDQNATFREKHADTEVVWQPMTCPSCGSKYQFAKEHEGGFINMDVYSRHLQALQQFHGSDYTVPSDEEPAPDPTQPVADDVAAPALEDVVKEMNYEEAQAMIRKLDLLEAKGVSIQGVPTLRELEQQQKLTVKQEGGEIEVVPKPPRPLKCVRCFQLENYGFTRGNIMSVSTQDFRMLLQQRFKYAPNNHRYVIIKVVDLFDFEGSFIPKLWHLIGNDHVLLLAVNKLDVLPSYVLTPALNRLRAWVRRQCKEHGLNVRGVFPISAKTGRGVPRMMQVATEHAAANEKAGNREIYLIGATNSGKSTLVNTLIRRRLVRRMGKFWEMQDDGKLSMTTSVLPGTTLGFVGLPLIPHRMGMLFDSPGIVPRTHVSTRLQYEELKATLPTNKVHPQTYRLKKGQSLLLGAMARVDHVGGRDFFFTVFVSLNVTIHVTKTTRVEEVVGKHGGIMLKPPFSQARVQECGFPLWKQQPQQEQQQGQEPPHVQNETNNENNNAASVPPLSSDAPEEVARYTVNGCGWKEAACDVVFPGLGWVAVTGVWSVELEVTAARHTKSMLRAPLLPYEGARTTRRYDGRPDKPRTGIARPKPKNNNNPPTPAASPVASSSRRR